MLHQIISFESHRSHNDGDYKLTSCVTRRDFKSRLKNVKTFNIDVTFFVLEKNKDQKSRREAFHFLSLSFLVDGLTCEFMVFESPRR